MNTPKFPMSWPVEGKGRPPANPSEVQEGPVGKCSTCGITLYREACPVFGRLGTLNS
jgi:hypothetical protein